MGQTPEEIRREIYFTLYDALYVTPGVLNAEEVVSNLVSDLPDLRLLLEDQLSVTIAEDRLTETTTVKELSDYLESLVEANKNLHAHLREETRLKRLSNEDLVMECVRDKDQSFEPVVEEMCHRLFPGWVERVEKKQ